MLLAGVGKLLHQTMTLLSVVDSICSFSWNVIMSHRAYLGLFRFLIITVTIVRAPRPSLRLLLQAVSLQWPFHCLIQAQAGALVALPRTSLAQWPGNRDTYTTKPPWLEIPYVTYQQTSRNITRNKQKAESHLRCWLTRNITKSGKSFTLLVEFFLDSLISCIKTWYKYLAICYEAYHLTTAKM